MRAQRSFWQSVTSPGSHVDASCLVLFPVAWIDFAIVYSKAQFSVANKYNSSLGIAI